MDKNEKGINKEPAADASVRSYRRMLFLKTFFTFLSRNKAYTAITVSGFAVSLMFVVILGVFTRQELLTDSMHTKVGRIYVLGMVQGNQDFVYGGSNYWLGHYMQKRFPEIEKTCALTTDQVRIKTPSGENIVQDMLFADSTFYDLFDFPLLQGDRSTVLMRPDAAVISEELAHRLFGNADPIGRPITYEDSLQLVVTGVMGSMEGSSLRKADVIVPFMQQKYIDERTVNPAINSMGTTEVFLLAKPGTNLKSKEKAINSYLKTVCSFFSDKDYPMTAKLIPMTGMYMSENTQGPTTRRANLTLARVLPIVSLVILLFSVINYVNLTVALSLKRAPEAAMRRLFGAQRREIMSRMVMESIMVCLVSLTVALALAVGLAPVADKILKTSLDIWQLTSPDALVTMVLFVVAVGAIAGVAPALVISRAKPIDVVRGTFRHTSRMIIGRAFIGLQSFITIVMVSVSLTMVLQIRHLIKAPLGYDVNAIMNINTPGDSTQLAMFRDEVARLPQVALTSIASASPLDAGWTSVIYRNGKPIDLLQFYVDNNYMKLLDIKVAKRTADPLPGCIYVNRSFLSAYGLTDNARMCQPFKGDGDDPNTKTFRIAGVLDDMYMNTITATHYQDTPMMIIVEGKQYGSLIHNLLIRVNGDLTGAYEAVQEVYRRVYNEPLDDDTPYIDQQVADRYSGEIQIAQIVTMFAFVAVVISILGLVAMSTYFIDQRRRETAIRKVFGSSDRQVGVKLMRQFMIPVVVALLFAVPTAWYLGSRFLADYWYRISPWTGVVLGGVLCLMVSVLALAAQCVKASRENPVVRLKDNG